MSARVFLAALFGGSALWVLSALPPYVIFLSALGWLCARLAYLFWAGR